MRNLITAVLALGLVAGVHAGQQAAPSPAVTAVSGSSWLHTLGVDYRETSLGRGAGRYGPGPSDLAVAAPAPVTLAASVTITGEDLYRLNCRPCHRAEGTGAPPEIKSVLPAVQGSTLQQLRGAVTKADLYARIEKGGQRMPARAHLRPADVDLLYGYLTTLVGTSAAAPLAHESIDADRLGENVVKGTCQICHDAAGPRPSDAAMLAGAIPSLASIMTTKSVAEFTDKVEHGAIAVMGTPPVPHRGRMPVFYYLTGTDLAAAYRYLKTYPPKP